MKIIGHRGAAGLALENSRSSLLMAIAHGVDMIELDVRLTADGHLIVIHDKVTDRVSTDKGTVREQTLADLQQFSLHNGETFLTLDAALDLIGTTPVIIELKDKHSVDELLRVLAEHPNARPSVASFQHEELREIHEAHPDIPTYVLEHYAPVEIIHTAHNIHATGIGLNTWLMNPLTYWMAKHYKLEIYLYTVNNRALAWFLHLFYPNITLCTNRPERFVKPR